MADYGFRLTRDECGKHSVPETIDRSWNLEEIRRSMGERVDAELARLKDSGIDAIAIMDDSHDIVEVRDKDDNTLVSWYEIEEFEQR